MLEDMLGRRLVNVDPASVLTEFFGKHRDNGPLGRLLPGALATWIGKDRESAMAWFDSQIAAGAFASRKLDGSNALRTLFEASAVVALMTSDPVGAGARIRALDEKDRAEVMRQAGASPEMGSSRGFISLARELLPADAAMAVISSQAMSRVQGCDFSRVTEFLDGIAATPGERSASVWAVVEKGIFSVVTERKLNAGDIGSIRNWVSSQSPEQLGEVTGKTLANVSVQPDQMPFSEVLGLLGRFREEGDGEPLLIHFLENTWSEEEANRQLCRELAAQVTDEARRAAILEHFQ